MNIHSSEFSFIMENIFQQQLADSRRRLIVDAAIAVIAEQGFQRTTVKQIAQMAGVADGTIYNYFKNKDAILLAIVEQFTEAEVRELDFNEAQKVPYAAFVQMYIKHRMDEIEANFAALKVVIAETIVNEALRTEVNRKIYTPAFEIAERYFQHLIAQGEMQPGDPVLRARLFAALPIGICVLRMLGDEHVVENWERYSAEIAALLTTFGATDDKTT